MGLTLDQLLVPPTRSEIRTQLLRALMGVFFTQRLQGYPPGKVYGSGTPEVEAVIVVSVVTAGQLGSAQVRVSTDAGVTFGAVTTIPSNGILAVAGTGISLVFENGPTGITESFRLADVFAIEIARSNFAPSSWQPGSAPLTIFETDAQLSEDIYALVKVVTAGGFVQYAEGDWLDLLGQNLYDLLRLQGNATKGLVLFTDGGAGPYTKGPGEVWVKSSTGKLYTNVAGFTLAQSGTLSVEFQAEQVGVSYNVANNSIQTLITSLPGVTINNPNPGSGTWITVQGTDKESDPLYRSRMVARWATLGVGPTEAVYDLWARTASAEVTRTKVRPSPTVPGQVEVFLAGPSGPVSGGAVTAVDAYIQPRILLTNTALVASASAHPITVTATIYVQAGFAAQATIDCAANIAALIAALDVGDTLYVSNVIEQLSLPIGVRNVSVSLPAADVVLSATEVATLTQNLTFVSI